MTGRARWADPAITGCPGPLVWYECQGGAVLLCSTCRYLTVTGNCNDQAHAYTTILREGLASR